MGETIVVNIRNSEYDIYIGRPSIWGNPFKVEKFGRERCIKLFEIYARKHFSKENLLQLKGKRLGCYCKPLDCHGDILVKLIQEISNG